MSNFLVYVPPYMHRAGIRIIIHISCFSICLISLLLTAFASVFGLYLLSGCAEQDCIHSSLGMGDLIAFGGTLLWSTSIIIGDSANKVYHAYFSPVNTHTAICTFT